MLNNYFLFVFIFILVILSYFIPSLWMLTTIVIAIVSIESYFKDKMIDIRR